MFTHVRCTVCRWLVVLAVSSAHARIEVGPKGATVSDLGSTNGTFVNGRKIGGGRTKIQQGDEVEFADQKFTVVEQPAAGGAARARSASPLGRIAPAVDDRVSLEPVSRFHSSGMSKRPRGWGSGVMLRRPPTLSPRSMCVW